MANKTVTKNVRFSPEEFNLIKAKAEYLNMSTSKYIRTIAIDGKIMKLEVPEYRNVILEMNRIGNNFNQIARRLNEQDSFYYDDFAVMKEEHEKLCLMLSQYLSTLHLKKL